MVYDTTVIHLRTSPVESVCITKFKKTTYESRKNKLSGLDTFL